MRKLDPQSRKLRSQMFKRFVIGFMVYVLAFLVLYAVFDIYISPAVGDFIADNTSEWQYQSVAEREKNLTKEGKGHYIQYGSEPIQEGADPETTIVKYRYIDTYMAIKQAKDNAIPIVFALGITVLIYLIMNKFVHYFDELSSSVAMLMTYKDKPVRLHKDLAIVERELESIRQDALHDERAAREAEKRKDDLVVYMAHDIRTPLTSAKGYLSLLNKDRPLTQEQRLRYADNAYRSIVKLEEYTDELFEITRLNTQTIELDKREVDLQMLCMQIADEMLPYAVQRELTIDTCVLDNAICVLDPNRIVRALSNILRNAITYADKDSTITFGGYADGRACVFTVRNTGVGIAPENRERVFEQFFREDEARNVNTGGAGLGLAIAKEIVEAHGGAIKADSTPTSTTFTVRLPGCICK